MDEKTLDAEQRAIDASRVCANVAALAEAPAAELREDDEEM